MTNEFRISKTDTIVGRAERTRNGFRHVVDYYQNGCVIASAKVCYLNRTWERWEFESAVNKLLGQMSFTTAKQKRIHDKCEKIALGKVDGMFKSVAAIAAMGEIFGKTQTEKNDWKTRMLKAGLENQGLIMPEDWDTLSEDEKTRRLDGVIKQLKE